MTQEEKQLLLKDLCARLPYGVKVNFRGNIEILHEAHIYKSVQTIVGESGILYDIGAPNVKPYLRPISSMTESEIEEHEKTFDLDYSIQGTPYDWLNAHYIDYRGLIGKGLALEAPEDMYKTE